MVTVCVICGNPLVEWRHADRFVHVAANLTLDDHYTHQRFYEQADALPAAMRKADFRKPQTWILGWP